MARYRLHQRSYIGDRLYEPDSEITVSPSVKPGPHWEPIDDEAKNAMANHAIEFTGEVPDVLARLEPMLADALAKRSGTDAVNAETIATAFEKVLARLLGGKSEPTEADIQAEVDRRVKEALEAAGVDASAMGAGTEKKGGKKG